MIKTANVSSDRIVLRPVVITEDEEFLKELYFTTRDDLARLPLHESEKLALMTMQYEAQKLQYSAQFPSADHDIILFDGKAVGRYMVLNGSSEIVGIDLAILPEYRNLGVGSVILQTTMNEAVRSSRSFRFHVAVGNPAKRLYDRLGFAVIGETAMHFEMELPAAPSDSAVRHKIREPQKDDA